MSWLCFDKNLQLTGSYPFGRKQFQIKLMKNDLKGRVVREESSGLFTWFALVNCPPTPISFRVFDAIEPEDSSEYFLAGLACSLGDDSKVTDWMVDTEIIVRLLNHDKPEKQVVKHASCTFTDAKRTGWAGKFTEITEDFERDGELTFEIEIGMKSMSENIVYNQKKSANFDRSNTLILVVDGHKFYTKKNMLIEKSEIFKEMIENIGSKKVHDGGYELQIIDAEPCFFRVFVQIVNGVSPEMKVAHIEPLMKLAERFKIPGVIESCKEYLKGDTDDVVEAIKLADRHGFLDIVDIQMKNVTTAQTLKPLLQGYRRMKKSTVRLLVSSFTHIV